MPDNFADWAKAEIARLRAEADTLQRALDKYRASNPGVGFVVRPLPSINGHHRAKMMKADSKSAFILNSVREAANAGGIDNDGLYSAAVDRFGAKFSRPAMRSILWQYKARSVIEQRDGKWFPKQEGPSA